MENATKALLIAAAVLVAILIISLGLVVYNMAAESVGSVDFSDSEIQAFNDKFTRFEGENESGSDVNALVQTVMNSNLKEASAKTNRFITVSGAVALTSGATQTPGKVPTGERYTIKATYDKKTSLITSINITKN